MNFNSLLKQNYQCLNRMILMLRLKLKKVVMTFLLEYGLNADDSGGYSGSMPANLGCSCAIKYTYGRGGLLVFMVKTICTIDFYETRIM